MIFRKIRGLPSAFSIERAHDAQRSMAKQLIQQLPITTLRFVAGVDVAYTEHYSIGAISLLDYRSLSIIQSQTAIVPTRFPYIPTLLAFREIAPLVAAFNMLGIQPDVILVDGHGLMHPHRCGLACQYGLLTRKPTIGVAKNPLIGRQGRFENRDWAPMLDGNEVVGGALRINDAVKPIYVSVGHLVSLEKAVEIIRHCTPVGRIPKPLRLAHSLAVETKRKTQNSQPAT